MKKKIVKILGVDPGGVNIGYCRLDSRQVGKSRVQTRILRNGMLQTIIDDMAEHNLAKYALRFRKELDLIVRADELDLIICERFQSRGRIGNVSEKSNIVIGLLLAYGAEKRIPTRLITASTWKNRANSQFDLGYTYKFTRTPPHELDAALLACFGAYHLFGMVPPFKHLKWRKNRLAFVSQLEQNTTSELYNRRAARL